MSSRIANVQTAQFPTCAYKAVAPVRRTGLARRFVQTQALIRTAKTAAAYKSVSTFRPVTHVRLVACCSAEEVLELSEESVDQALQVTAFLFFHILFICTFDSFNATLIHTGCQTGAHAAVR